MIDEINVFVCGGTGKSEKKFQIEEESVMESMKFKRHDRSLSTLLFKMKIKEEFTIMESEIFRRRFFRRIHPQSKVKPIRK